MVILGMARHGQAWPGHPGRQLVAGQRVSRAHKTVWPLVTTLPRTHMEVDGMAP